MKVVKEFLWTNRDEQYGAFQGKLLPGMDLSKVIGVRTPILRSYAKSMIKDGLWQDFLVELPHETFDENQLHGFILSELKDYDRCMEELERFLPYMDNWATVDQTSPKVFKKHREELWEKIPEWLEAEQPYIVRFGIGMLMQHYLAEDFRPEALAMVTGIHREEYYVNMEIAWYMATALTKQWEASIPYLENPVMDPWTHNKTIQKARESYRITAEQKEYLKSLKIRKE